MKNSKLVTLLRTFTVRDWQQFRNYIRSPLFNQSEKLTELADRFKQYQDHPTENAEHDIWQSLWPHRSFDRKDWHRWCNRLHQLAQDFVAWQNWQQEEAVTNEHLLRALHERQLDKHFQLIHKQAGEKMAVENRQGLVYFQRQFRLAALAETRYSDQAVRGFHPFLQPVADAFDCYAIAQKLSYLCAVVSYNKQQPGAYQQYFSEESMQMAETLDDIPLIGLYRRLYLMLTGTMPEQWFTQLRNNVEKFDAVLPREDLRRCYLSLINFCIERIRYGEQQYAATLLSLYETALKNDILTDRGVISPWTFKNIVKLGLGLRRFGWVEQFIHQYAPLLIAEQRREALHFNLADLHYHRRQYAQAQLHLREVEFSDIHYLLHARVMLVKIFYETEAWDALESQLASFRIFLLRHQKISREVKKPYLNFIRLTERLLRMLPEQNQRVQRQIRKTPMLTDRSWLLKQLGGRTL